MDSVKTGKIYGINGPVIYLKGKYEFKMSEMVYVGKERLVGEVISLDKDLTTIQVYEETSGLRPGEEVVSSGDAVSVTLAPGILDNIFDGIERPLERIADTGGSFITRGANVDFLDRTRLWDTHITVAVGDTVHGGTIIAEVPETRAIVHKCMVPPNVDGVVVSVVEDGQYTIDDVLVTIELTDGGKKELTMTQKWPIRVPRPVHKRYPASVPLITGQRILDTMFPIAKGGTAAIPGGFGTGKTMTQHQIAKWSDAEEIETFKNIVEEFTGNKVTADKLAESIKLINNKRKALERLYDLRKNETLPISGCDALLISQIAFYDDPARFTQMTNKLCDELEKRVADGVSVVPAGTKRIMLTGTPLAIPNWKLHNIVETSGAAVVCEEMCTGTRYFEKLVDESGTTLEEQYQALANRYMNINCACFTPNSGRIDDILRLAKEYKVDGIIDVNLKFCNLYDTEGYFVERAMKEAGIPVLGIETDYTDSDAQQLRTRVSAFIEMLNN